MFTEDPFGNIGYFTDPETGKSIRINLATGKGLDRFDQIREKKLREFAEKPIKPKENDDETIDFESAKTSREVNGIFASIADRFKHHSSVELYKTSK